MPLEAIMEVREPSFIVGATFYISEWRLAAGSPRSGGWRLPLMSRHDERNNAIEVQPLTLPRTAMRSHMRAIAFFVAQLPRVNDTCLINSQPFQEVCTRGVKYCAATIYHGDIARHQ
ncbi:hypothetical protein ACJJTC_018874 [Scirpophaga incertulas]